MKLFLVSGFLGSGKTTAINEASAQLSNQGLQVGIITNDQGEKLVDSRFLESQDIALKEVNNGCFCCNYSQFDAIIGRFAKQGKTDVIFAEAVGSCTDIIATVAKPLGRFYPNLDAVISVFADAQLIPFLHQSSRLFHDSVNYIYKKQLEEADVLIINKVDLITPEELKGIKKLLKEFYPNKKVMFLNSYNSENIVEWINTLFTFPKVPSRESLKIDYDEYGTGEAQLAWLDAEIEIKCPTYNAPQIGIEIANGICARIRKEKLTIGHLKFLLKAGEKQEKMSYTALKQEQTGLTFTNIKTPEANLLINARVQTSPDYLKNLIRHTLGKIQVENCCKIKEKSLSAFKPEYPKPTYRIEN